MLIRWIGKQYNFWFCKFKYYKQLAAQINYTLPNINEQLGYAPSDKCWLLGYRLKKSFPQNIKHQNLLKQLQFIQKQEKEKESQISLQYDPLGRQQLNFQTISQFAQKNDLDVCSADKQAKQVSLVKLRQTVYRKFYQTKLFKKNSTAKKYKQIRVPQNISDHDIKNKVRNIKSLISKGEFSFKIYSQNDTQKSQKALKKLCQYLGKNETLKIQEHQIIEKTHRRPAVIIQRWVITLNFANESKVDYQQINKKWRRYLMNKKIAESKNLNTDKAQLFTGIQNQNLDVQRQLIKQLRQLKVSLPNVYRQYEELQNNLDVNGKQFFKSFTKNYINQLIQNNQNNLPKKKKSNDQIKYVKNTKKEEQDSQQDSQLQEQSEEDFQKSKIHNSKLQQALKDMRVDDEELNQMKKKMRNRTVQQILIQMEQIRGDKIQLDPIEVYKLKLLEVEIKETLKLAGYKPKI